MSTLSDSVPVPLHFLHKNIKRPIDLPFRVHSRAWLYSDLSCLTSFLSTSVPTITSYTAAVTPLSIASTSLYMMDALSWS